MWIISALLSHSKFNEIVDDADFVLGVKIEEIFLFWFVRLRA